MTEGRLVVERGMVARRNRGRGACPSQVRARCWAAGGWRLTVLSHVLTLATGATVLAGVSAEAADPASVSVEVTARRWARDSLEFTLVLKKPKRLDVPLDALPWGAFPNLQIVAVTTDSRGTAALARPNPVREPVESPPTTLVAGQRLRARVPLNEYVEGLAEVLRDSEVLVFWSYRLDVPGGGHSNRTGGWVELPKEQ